MIPTLVIVLIAAVVFIGTVRIFRTRRSVAPSAEDNWQQNNHARSPTLDNAAEVSDSVSPIIVSGLGEN